MMLDVEQLLADTTQIDQDALYRNIDTKLPAGRTVLFADDSAVARNQIVRTLTAMGLNHIGAANGAEAWRELSTIADKAAAFGRPVRDSIQLVLTDIEMPEMDGYMLAKRIKSDPRFTGIPVVMHSSLSGESNQQLGLSVGIDDYVSKFEPAKLAESITRILS